MLRLMVIGRHVEIIKIVVQCVEAPAMSIQLVPSWQYLEVEERRKFVAYEKPLSNSKDY